MALTPDGHVIYDVHISLSNLPPASELGGAEYVAWVTSPDLDRAERLSPIGHDGTAQGRVTMNKFIILVTAEHTPVGAHWTGRVALRGFSPSTFLQNFSSEELFLGGTPPC